MKLFVTLVTAFAGAPLGVLAKYPHSDNPPKITKNSRQDVKDYSAPIFPLLGFEKYKNNPILRPDPDYAFESAYLYNPAGIVIDDRVFLLYRAQGPDKLSRVGLAWSSDGYSFTRYTKPILEPSFDYEKGGVEDPRIIRHDGVFYMTYSAYDGTTARLALATSTDLVSWQKRGLILPNATDVVDQHATAKNVPTPRQGWSKSGAIVPEQINGSWIMHWGDSFLYTATSKDLLNWNFTQYSEPESGPPPVKTRDGRWLKVYNGGGAGIAGYQQFQYSVGQMLFSDPYNPIARVETPILAVDSASEEQGQVDRVVFAEALVQFKGLWFLYFGQGDSVLGVATTPVQPDYPRHPKGY